MYINLKSNNIGDEGVKYLATLLRYPIVLYLDDNKLTNIGDGRLIKVIENR